MYPWVPAHAAVSRPPGQGGSSAPGCRHRVRLLETHSGMHRTSWRQRRSPERKADAYACRSLSSVAGFRIALPYQQAGDTPIR